ncbi:hypothetical protein GW17_00014552 [Ensete ventricosum]|nr:hypothetical protein GW17_00014552 [Ensete ventricosum]
MSLIWTAKETKLGGAAEDKRTAEEVIAGAEDRWPSPRRISCHAVITRQICCCRLHQSNSNRSEEIPRTHEPRINEQNTKGHLKMPEETPVPCSPTTCPLLTLPTLVKYESLLGGVEAYAIDERSGRGGGVGRQPFDGGSPPPDGLDGGGEGCKGGHLRLRLGVWSYGVDAGGCEGAAEQAGVRDRHVEN